ncbi:MAG: phytanoyl-CoA dioxygenase family protein [Proteobacteria bacterium]|nr:phytanoyl-CoA dioxygenase family protein [Pseudomonadota bacterium]
MSRQELEQYRSDGFFVRQRVFVGAALTGLCAAADRAAARAVAACADGRAYYLDGKRFVDTVDATVQFEHTPGSETPRVIEPVHHFEPSIDALLDDERLVQPMRDLVGCQEVALWTDKLNLKSAYGSGFPWHQDAPYWIHSCAHVHALPNVMVALDDADLVNGCFRVIRGSHRHGNLPGTDDGSQLGGLLTDIKRIDLRDEVALALPAGSLAFFDPYTVHGSQPNRSPRQRRALVLTYQPAGHQMLKAPRVRNCGVQLLPSRPSTGL